MKQSIRALVIVLIAILFVSCNDDEKSGPTGPEESKGRVNDSVVLIDENIEPETQVMVDGNKLTYSKDGGLPTNVQAGDIVVDYIDGGHLRRVLSVTESTDSSLIIETEPATLADYLQDVSIDTLLQMWHESSTKSIPRRATSFPMQPVYLREGVSVEESKLVLDEVVLSDTLINTPELQVLVEGFIEFEPDYRFILDVSGGNVQLIRTTATGDLDLDLDATASSPALQDALSGETLLAEFSYAFYIPVVGPFGVYGDVELSFYGGYRVWNSDEMTVTTGVFLNADAEAGAQYANGEWGPIWSLDIETGYDAPSFSEIDTISARVYIKPELKLELFELLGPAINVDPGVQGDFSYRINPFWMSVDVFADLTANFEFTATAFGYDLIDYVAELAYWRYGLYQYQLNEAPEPPTDPFPANNSTGVPIASDLSWFCFDPDEDDLTFDVYFGTNSTPPLVSEGQDSSTFALDDLTEATTYYWKVVADDGNGHEVEGPLWSFTTVGTPTLDPELVAYELDPAYPQVYPGQSFTARYQINNPNAASVDIQLDSRWRRQDGAYGELEPTSFPITIAPGTAWYERTCTIPVDMQPGVYAHAWFLLWLDNNWIDHSTYANDSFEVLEGYQIIEQDFELGNTGTYVTMVWIRDGDFMMGAQDGEVDALTNEYPRHQVTISQGFWMGKYEVTQEQWEAVMDVWDFYFDGNPTHPAEMVSHNDIINDFLPAINATEPSDPWRLPTEAEWEFACRAGYDETRFWWGDDPGYAELEDYAWFCDNANSTEEVGQKTPNPWGLYDMHGNVWEICSDYYSQDFYPDYPVVDPENTTYTSRRIRRGGTWYTNYGGEYCRSARRDDVYHDYAYMTQGFRLVRVSPSP